MVFPRPRALTGVIALIISGALGWWNPLPAQVVPQSDGLPQKTLKQWVLKVYTVEDGLPSSQVLDILQTQDGYLWLATPNGLGRFNGREFKHFPSIEEDSATQSRCIELHEDPADRLWITTPHSVVMYTNGVFTTYPVPDPNPKLAINYPVVTDAGGQLWLGHHDRLYRLTGESLEAVPMPSQLEQPWRINALLADPAGPLWVVTDVDGVYRYADGEFTHVVNSEQLPGNGLWDAVARDGEGQIWLSNLGQGLVRLNGNTLSEFDHPALLQQRHNDIHYGRDGSLWLANLRGLQRIQGENLDQLTAEDGLPDTRLRCVFQDREGNVWMGTSGTGLYQLKNGMMTTYDEDDGVTDSLVLCLDQSPEGTPWLGTYSSAYPFVEGRMESLDDIVPKTVIWSIEFGPDGEMFLGTEDGLAQYGNGTLKWYKEWEGQSLGRIKTVYRDGQGLIWVGRYYGGTYRLTQGRLEKVPALGESTVECIHQSEDGVVWFATEKGLYRKEKDRMTLVPGTPERLTSLFEDDEGTLWMGGWGTGLARYDKRNPVEIFTQKDGLYSDINGWIQEDDFGMLWMSTKRGVYRVNKDDFQRYQSGEIPRLQCFSYGLDDGLEILAVGKYGGPAGFKDRNGRLFFRSEDGMVVIDPRRLQKESVFPEVVVEEILVDHEPVMVQDDLEVLPGKRDLEIGFASLTFGRPKHVAYKYRLEGQDPDWIEAGNRQRAYYTNLKPGAYSFQVMADNGEGVWSSASASLALNVLPAWWQTTWFLLGAIATLALAAYAVHRWRLDDLTRQHVALEREVVEREVAQSNLQTALSEITTLRDRLQSENTLLKKEISVRYRHHEIIGESAAIKQALSLAEEVAGSNSTVLIEGETGSGKELFARWIHQLSERKDRPLVEVNCAALPPTLMEAELFGRVKGAYTGAISSQEGRFEAANGATLFLDEIGELPLDLQAKLLRVLEEGAFERLGSTKTIKTDVRVITATNRDLKEMVSAGTFREDLFFRLNVFPIPIPPLRERAEDIPLITWAFVDQMNTAMGKKVDKISQSTMKQLQAYTWPGNVRELRNIIERGMILSKGTQLRVEIPKPRPAENSEIATLEEATRQTILRALEHAQWRIRGPGGAAEILGLKPTTLESRMAKLGIQRPSGLSGD